MMPIDLAEPEQENNPFGPEFGHRSGEFGLDRDILGDISNMPEPKRAKSDVAEVAYCSKT